MNPDINHIKGTVSKVDYVREDSTSHGKLLVYNYEFKEYTGIMQARHKFSAHPVGTQAIFELKFLDKNRNIAVGNVYDAARIDEIRSRESEEAEKNEDHDNVVEVLTIAHRIALLDVAAKTPGVKGAYDVMQKADMYLDWLQNES